MLCTFLGFPIVKIRRIWGGLDSGVPMYGNYGIEMS